MSKTDSRKLVCTACKYENEVERVYCHNCGEKLDRSLLPKIEEVKAADEKEKTGKKVKKLMNPNRFDWLQNLKRFLLIELLAAVVAAGYLASQAPEEVPPMKIEGFPQSMVGEEWAGLMGTRVPAAVAFLEFDVNYHLRKTVKGADGPLGIKYERAFALFAPNSVTLTVQRNAWGLTIYNGVTFQPVSTAGKWKADVQRISVGRLTIPLSIAKLVKLDTLVQDAFSRVLDKEIKQLDRVEAIEVGNKVIKFKTKPLQ
jgi:ribosomal protein L20A (L18A)